MSREIVVTVGSAVVGSVTAVVAYGPGGFLMGAVGGLLAGQFLGLVAGTVRTAYLTHASKR